MQLWLTRNSLCETNWPSIQAFAVFAAEIKGMNHHTWPLVLCLCMWERTEEGTGSSGTKVTGGDEPSWVLETKLEGHLQGQQVPVATKPAFLHQYWVYFFCNLFCFASLKWREAFYTPQGRSW